MADEYLEQEDLEQKEQLDLEQQGQEEQKEELLAGKYKSTEELIKALKNQQSEFSKLQQVVKDYEELLSAHQQYLKRDPATGKLVLDFQPGKREEEEDILSLSEEELEMATPVEKKILRVLQMEREEKRREREKQEALERDRIERDHFWKMAVKEFKDLEDENSEFRQLAERIATEKFVRRLPDGSLYLPPEANYYAALEAHRQMQRRNQNIDSETMREQNNFVAKDSGRKTSQPKQLSDAEYLALSEEEQEEYDRKSIGL